MKISLQYLAGFFDGEGSLMILHKSARSYQTAHIQIEAHLTNNNLKLLKSIQKQLGGKLVTLKNKHRNIYRLRWLKKEAIQQLLNQLYPFLILKRPNAKLMLEYITARPAHKRSRLSKHDFSFAKRMTALNKELRFRLEKPPVLPVKAEVSDPRRF
jgi:hypothetical protein